MTMFLSHGYIGVKDTARKESRGTRKHRGKIAGGFSPNASETVSELHQDVFHTENHQSTLPPQGKMQGLTGNKSYRKLFSTKASKTDHSLGSSVRKGSTSCTVKKGLGFGNKMRNSFKTSLDAPKPSTPETTSTFITTDKGGEHQLNTADGSSFGLDDILTDLASSKTCTHDADCSSRLVTPDNKDISYWKGDASLNCDSSGKTSSSNAPRSASSKCRTEYKKPKFDVNGSERLQGTTFQKDEDASRRQKPSKKIAHISPSPKPRSRHRSDYYYPSKNITSNMTKNLDAQQTGFSDIHEKNRLCRPSSLGETSKDYHSSNTSPSTRSKAECVHGMPISNSFKNGKSDLNEIEHQTHNLDRDSSPCKEINLFVDIGNRLQTFDQDQRFIEGRTRTNRRDSRTESQTFRGESRDSQSKCTSDSKLSRVNFNDAFSSVQKGRNVAIDQDNKENFQVTAQNLTGSSVRLSTDSKTTNSIFCGTRAQTSNVPTSNSDSFLGSDDVAISNLNCGASSDVETSSSSSLDESTASSNISVLATRSEKASRFFNSCNTRSGDVEEAGCTEDRCSPADTNPTSSHLAVVEKGMCSDDSRIHQAEKKSVRFEIITPMEGEDQQKIVQLITITPIKGFKDDTSTDASPSLPSEKGMKTNNVFWTGDELSVLPTPVMDNRSHQQSPLKNQNVTLGIESVNTLLAAMGVNTSENCTKKNNYARRQTSGNAEDEMGFEAKYSSPLSEENVTSAEESRKAEKALKKVRRRRKRWSDLMKKGEETLDNCSDVARHNGNFAGKASSNPVAISSRFDPFAPKPFQESGHTLTRCCDHAGSDIIWFSSAEMEAAARPKTEDLSYLESLHCGPMFSQSDVHKFDDNV